MLIARQGEQSTYIEKWHELTQDCPFLLFKEKLPELCLACLIVLGELDEHVQSRLQVKSANDGFCEGIPACGDRANEHFGLDWWFQTKALGLEVNMQSWRMDDALRKCFNLLMFSFSTLLLRQACTPCSY